MKKITIFLVTIQCFFTVSCLGQETAGQYYKDCMDNRLLAGGTDFYKKMSSVEELLLSSKILESTDRMNYVNVFSKLFANDDFSNLYKDIQENIYQDFTPYFPALYLFSLCSDIEINETGSNCNCLNIQKNVLKKYTFKPYDDKELLDDLFIFTDFDDDILRMHITYLFLLNLEMKYGEE